MTSGCEAPESVPRSESRRAVDQASARVAYAIVSCAYVFRTSETVIITPRSDAMPAVMAVLRFRKAAEIRQPHVGDEADKQPADLVEEPRGSFIRCTVRKSTDTPLALGADSSILNQA